MSVHCLSRVYVTSRRAEGIRARERSERPPRVSVGRCVPWGPCVHPVPGSERDNIPSVVDKITVRREQALRGFQFERDLFFYVHTRAHARECTYEHVHLFTNLRG